MNRLQKLWTVSTLVLLAGCAATDFPEIPTALRDQSPAERIQISPAAPLPGADELKFEMKLVDGEQMACTPHRFALEQLVIAADANTAALAELIDAYLETEREADRWLIAGQAAERMADQLRSLYLSEANRSRALEIGIAGGSVLLLILTGAAAL